MLLPEEQAAVQHSMAVEQRHGRLSGPFSL